MAKGQKKIKRYNRIYGGRSALSRVMRVVLTVVVLAGLACLGWALYEPVSQFLSGTMQVPEEEPQESLSEAQASVPEQPPEEKPPVVLLELSQVKGAYLPLSSLQDPLLLSQTLDALKEQGINAILIDGKNAQGQVLYRSANQTVEEVSAQVPNAVDLQQITTLAKAKDMIVIARIYAFRDPICPLVNKKAAVKYQDTEMLWLDNSKEYGGKSWLNPYSELAQMYIADLSLECIRSGCTAVLLDGVQFPTGYSLELAGYGVQTKTRRQVLSDFVQDMEELLQENGGVLLYASSSMAMLGMESSSYESGGLDYPIRNFCPDLRPASFTGEVRPESLTMENPQAQPYETVKAVLSQLQEKGKEKSFLPLLQADNTPSPAPEYTKAQIRALEECGVTGYILYSAEGEYTLS